MAKGNDEFNKVKMEIASELGINMHPEYNGHISARDAGRLGGKIGGNMVKKMIKYAENNMFGNNE
jgi:hypothetical protein